MAGVNVAIPGVVDAVEIGRGGFGVVYRATETDLGRDVAVKMLTGELDERARARFERERRAMGALSSHPNIITIFRSGVAEDGGLYLVMEYLPGGSLAEQIAESGPTGWQDTLRIGIELSGALESAHRAGVLHRDVKPGNVIIDDLGRAKLGDFGIARLDGSPETKSAVVTASVAHAPPEVIAGDKPDERSDVYSLASTLFELASGSPAYARPTDESMIPMLARIVHDPLPDLRQQGVPDQLALLLERAMAKQPDQRFGSAGEFGRVLGDCQRALGLPETRLWIAGEAQDHQSERLGQSTRIVAPPASDTDSSDIPAPNQRSASSIAPSPQQPSQQQPPQQQAPPQTPAQFHAPQTPAQFHAPQPPAQFHAPQPPAQHQGFAPGPGHQPQPVYAQPVNHGGGGLAPPPGQSFNTGTQAGGQGPGGSNTGLLVTLGIGGFVLLVGLVVWAASRGAEVSDPSASPASSQGGQNSNGSDSGSTSSLDGSSTSTTAPTTTIAQPPSTNPPRLEVLRGLPAQPSIEEPFTDYRTLVDPEGAFAFQVPSEWDEDLPVAGQITAGADLDALLNLEPVSGVSVSGIQWFSSWDADGTLELISAEDADEKNPCIRLLSEPFVDGRFDGVIFAEECSADRLLQVGVLVASEDRDAVIYVLLQVTDERDFAAFEELLDTFILFDPALLPLAS